MFLVKTLFALKAIKPGYIECASGALSLQLLFLIFFVSVALYFNYLIVVKLCLVFCKTAYLLIIIVYIHCALCVAAIAVDCHFCEVLTCNFVLFAVVVAAHNINLETTSHSNNVHNRNNILFLLLSIEFILLYFIIGVQHFLFLFFHLPSLYFVRLIKLLLSTVYDMYSFTFINFNHIMI